MKAKSHLELAECCWAHGAEVEVALTGRHLQVSPAKQKFVWDGELHRLDFDVEVARDAPIEKTRLKFDVVIKGFVVARLRLDLDIRQGILWRLWPNLKLVTEQLAARTAFASYASEDRLRVLDRVASVQILAGLDVWMDCLSLKPNDEWKKHLAAVIPARDLFILFWSEKAAKSEWVEWEWRRALRSKGRDDLQVHPLESCPKAPLPAELQDLHIGDPLMAMREAEIARQEKATPGSRS